MARNIRDSTHTIEILHNVRNLWYCLTYLYTYSYHSAVLDYCQNVMFSISISTTTGVWVQTGSAKNWSNKSTYNHTQLQVIRHDSSNETDDQSPHCWKNHMLNIGFGQTRTTRPGHKVGCFQGFMKHMVYILSRIQIDLNLDLSNTTKPSMLLQCAAVRNCTVENIVHSLDVHFQAKNLPFCNTFLKQSELQV